MNELRIFEQRFLSQLSVLEYKYHILESYDEQFNIFSALHRVNDEVRLHSRFISVLLSPLSRHKKNDQFLKLFLESMGIYDFDTENVKVYPTENDKSEYKEIDILIINRESKQAIIIENKINAQDSNHPDRGQLEGYFNRINKEDGIPSNNIRVLYLSKNRRDPSSESLGEFGTIENMNGKVIDYEHEIADWLNLCLQCCINQPFMRESIIQYINLIKQMTNNDTDIRERLEIIDLIASSKENMDAAKMLFSNIKHVKWHTVSEFWIELQESLERIGCIVNESPTEKNITDTTHYEQYKKDYIANNDYGLKFKVMDGLYIWIWNGVGENWLYWGVSKSELSIEFYDRLTDFNRAFPLFFNKNESEEQKTYFWKYFNLGDEVNIFFPDFSLSGTFNLINKKYRDLIINEKLVPEIISFLENLNNVKTT